MLEAVFVLVRLVVFLVLQSTAQGLFSRPPAWARVGSKLTGAHQYADDRLIEGFLLLVAVRAGDGHVFTPHSHQLRYDPDEVVN
ncbi:hypothetical protein D3C86_1859980 [compost metagenome]